MGAALMTTTACLFASLQRPNVAEMAAMSNVEGATGDRYYVSRPRRLERGMVSMRGQYR
jgi:hypothetical protein